VGIVIARRAKLSQWVIYATNVIQTIPALALLAVLMLVLGLGENTVIASLFLYSLLPIVRSTYAGIRGVDAALLEFGRGLGLTKFQLLRMVQLPLALSVMSVIG